jgi:adenine deaminase
LQHGAVATSVGHDSHNLVIAGTNDVDMAVAGNCVRMNEGGLAIARDGKVLADLPLPAAGLMSVLSLEETDQRLEQLKRISHELGISEDIDAFMTLAFVSLPVIPKLRISTFGVVDTEQQCIVESIF